MCSRPRNRRTLTSYATSHTKATKRAMTNTLVRWRAVGRRLRVTRSALGITEQKAAEVFGISLRTYRRYEAGQPQRSAAPRSILRGDTTLASTGFSTAIRIGSVAISQGARSRSCQLGGGGGKRLHGHKARGSGSAKYKGAASAALFLCLQF